MEIKNKYKVRNNMIKNKKHPKEFFKFLKKRKFNMFETGDIIFTNNHDHWLAKLIRFKAKRDNECPMCNHVETYVDDGLSFTADYKMRFHGIKKYFRGKHDIFVIRRKDLSYNDKIKLIREMNKWKGKPYDFLGILWQGLDGLFRTSLFSQLFNKNIFAYCSELEQRIWWGALKITIDDKKVGVSTPNNIFIHLMGNKEWDNIFWMCKSNLTNKWSIEW